MASIQDTDLLLINRGGADYQAQVSELPPGPIGPPGADGADGNDGADGADGNDGADGTAATVSVGTTTTSAPGTDASVLNSGDTTTAVFEFTIPKGDKGDKGDTGTSVSFQGTIDLTADSVPASPAIGDLYINTDPGVMSAAWQTATSEGAISVQSGDDVIFNDSSQWSYIPSGTQEISTDLDIDNRGTETLDITSSTGADVTVPAATDALAGLMTAADKTDLDDLVAGGGSLWDRNGTTVQPKNNGDTVAVTAADGTENIVLKPDGNLQAESVWASSPTGADPNSGANAGTRLFSDGKFISSGTSGTRSEWWVTGDSVANIYIRNSGQLQIKGDPNGGIADGLRMDPSLYYQASASAGTKALYQGYKTGDSNPTFKVTANGTGEFAGDVTINTDKITLDATDGNISLTGDIINTTVDGDQDIICDGSGLTKLTEYNLNPMEVVTKHDIGTGANEVPVNGFLGTLAYKDDLAIQDGTTVALLPTSPIARVGNITRVTDGAAALTWGATVTGGGTAQYLVWYNGTNWTVFGA